MSRKTTRKDILMEAMDIVNGRREEEYGTPEDNFNIIGNLWTTYLGVPIFAVDVSMMMALLKIARIRTGVGTDDSFIDLAGYAACGGEIASSVRSGIESTDDSQDKAEVEWSL